MGRTSSAINTGHHFKALQSGKGRNVKFTASPTKALKRYRKAQLEEQTRLVGLWEDQRARLP